MVTALILLDVERGRVNEVAQQVAALPGVAEVYSVAGRCDLAVVARVAANDDLAALVTNRMVAVSGITNTETLIAFRAYARRDVEAAFAVGANG
jgi:DNA-binding Lrp family transcriptional regulator